MSVNDAQIRSVLQVLSTSIESAISSVKLLMSLLEAQPASGPAATAKPPVKRERPTGREDPPSRIPRGERHELILHDIPEGMADDDIRAHFSAVGADVVTRLNRPPKNKSMCFVGFASAEALQKALAMEAPKKGDQAATMKSNERLEQSNRTGEPPAKIHRRDDHELVMHKVPEGLTDDDIRAHFSAVGADALLRINRPKHGKICFVSFSSADTLQKALAMEAPKKGDQVATVKANNRS